MGTFLAGMEHVKCVMGHEIQVAAGLKFSLFWKQLAGTLSCSLVTSYEGGAAHRRATLPTLWEGQRMATSSTSGHQPGPAGRQGGQQAWKAAGTAAAKDPVFAENFKAKGGSRHE